MVRAFGWYVAPSGLATTPSRPAPSNRLNHSFASSGSEVVRVRWIGGTASASASSRRARRTSNGWPINDSSPSASRSKATNPAGVVSASIRTRESAGWIRSWSFSNSRRSPMDTKISPSSTQRSGVDASTASTTSGK